MADKYDSKVHSSRYQRRGAWKIETSGVWTGTTRMEGDGGRFNLINDMWTNKDRVRINPARWLVIVNLFIRIRYWHKAHMYTQQRASLLSAIFMLIVISSQNNKMLTFKLPTSIRSMRYDGSLRWKGRTRSRHNTHTRTQSLGMWCMGI